MAIKKREFKSRTVTLSCEDVGMLGYDHVFEVLSDPPPYVLGEALELVIAASEAAQKDQQMDEPDKFDVRFHEIASHMLVDCDIKGVDFSTPETTKDAFLRKDLDENFLVSFFVAYLSYLANKRGKLKKTLTSQKSEKA